MKAGAIGATVTSLVSAVIMCVVGADMRGFVTHVVSMGIGAAVAVFICGVYECIVNRDILP